MNIREAAQYFLENHKTFKADQIAWGEDPLKQAIEHLENNGNSDPFLASADTYLEISGFESISGNPVIVEWYEYEFELTFTNVWCGQYRYETEGYKTFDEAVAAASPYLLNPVQLNNFADFEPSVNLQVKESGESIDLYDHLGLNKELILGQEQHGKE